MFAGRRSRSNLHGKKKPWYTPSLVGYGNGLSHTGANLHMLPQSLWATNDFMSIKSKSRQKFSIFTEFNFSNERTKQERGGISIVWAIWISEINRSALRAASGSCRTAALLFLRLSNRSTSHNRPARHHKPASAASNNKRFESLKVRRKRSLRKADVELINWNQFPHRHIVTFGLHHSPTN